MLRNVLGPEVEKNFDDVYIGRLTLFTHDKFT